MTSTLLRFATFICVLQHSISAIPNISLLRRFGATNSLPSFSERQGLTNDPCTSDIDCDAPRECVEFSDGEPVECPSFSSSCVCDDIVLCDTLNDCVTGEICITGTDASTFCSSENALSQVGDSINFERCSNSFECKGFGNCLAVEDGQFVPCATRDNCRCRRRNEACEITADCDDGESCITGTDGGTFCASAEALSQFGDKVNFERCTHSFECKGLGDCLAFEDGLSVPCATHDTCRCRRRNEVCETTADCESGESCRGNALSTLCIASNLNAVQVNFEPCLALEDCVTPRVCVDSESLDPCTGAGACMCLSTSPQCTSDDSCDHREEFCRIVNEDLSVCASALVSNSSFLQLADPLTGLSVPDDDLPPGQGGCIVDADCVGGEECRKNSNGERICQDINNDNVCISTHHLHQMRETGLMYSKHRLARVLCDAQDSCATRGHIVIHNGTPMMMSSYCLKVRCVQKIMAVNSPRYERAKTIGSNTEGLVFSSFAARYNSKMEERLLSAAIRLGL